MMQQVMEVAAALGIALFYHIIVGRDGRVSFKERVPI